MCRVELTSKRRPVLTKRVNAPSNGFTRFGFADTPLPVGWGWLAGFS
jgi:hypothetical protein